MFEEIFREHVRGLVFHGDQGRGHCPFHYDKRPSFSFNLESGLWICFAGCGSGNIYQFADRLGIDRSKINGRIDFSVKPIRNRMINPIPELSIPRKREARKFHNYLIENWNLIDKPSLWSIEVIKHTYTGYDQKIGTFTFVYTNQLGKAVNIRWHKKFSVRGHGRCTIFPLHLVRLYKTKTPLILCEGEIDTLTSISLGYQAATATNGANGIPKDLSPIRNFQNIYVLYDNDEPGIIGAKKIANVIKTNFSKINVDIIELRKK